MSNQQLFWIGFLSDAGPGLPRRRGVRYGRIVINGYQETFAASMSFWDESDYERQWIEGLRRITEGKPSSCLLTSVGDPQNAVGATWWTIYSDEAHVSLQSRLVLVDEIGTSFDPWYPYAHVPVRRQIDEEGQRVSEWRVSVAAIRDYLDETGVSGEITSIT